MLTRKYLGTEGKKERGDMTLQRASKTRGFHPSGTLYCLI